MAASSVWATFCINGLFFLTIMALFEYYRNKVVDLYAPRSRGHNPKYAMPREGYFQWVVQLYEITDDQMYRIAGLDGYVFLHFLMFCCKLTTICGFAGAFIIIPCYVTSPGLNNINGFETISMANVSPNGDRLWVSFVFVYLFTFLYLYLIHKEYEHFVTMRKKFFHGTVDIVPLQTKYTVQVENIPEEFRTSEKLYAVFDALFPGEVLFAHVVVSTPELDKLVAERDSVRDQLERAIAVYEGNGRRERPLLDLKKLGLPNLVGEREVDSINFLTRRLHKLCARTARLQNVIAEQQNEPAGEPKSPYSLARNLTSAVNVNEHILETNHDNNSSDKLVQKTNNGGNVDELEDADGSGEGNCDGDGDGNSSDEDCDPPLGIELSSVYNPLRGTTEQTTRKFSSILNDVRNRIKAHFITTTGFVTFRSRRAHNTAVKTAILLEQYPYMTALQAPPPVDVIWSNLSASTMSTEETAYLSAGAYYGSLTFWGGVMAFVAAMSTMSTLEEYLPFIRNFDVIAYAIVEGILPVIVVLSFSTLVSGIIGFIAQNVEKRKTNSAVEREIFKWYFMYQMANIYLILVAGSVWESIVSAIQRPEAIITYLSAALPSVSTFFINYIITIWLSGVPYKLIRRFRAIEYLFYRYSMFPRYMTRRMMKNGPFRDTRVQYGTELSDVLYVLCVVLLYWVISPVILIFATPLFWSWYYNWKYQYVFVVTRTYESGGDLWYRLYMYSMLGLLAGTITFMAYMGIKEGITQGPLLFPLPIIILVAWHHTEACFKFQSQSMPFDLNIKDDFQNHACNEERLRDFTANFMKQPNLVGPAEIFPYPYRVGGEPPNRVPLFDANGALNEEYVDELPAPVDVTTHASEV